MFKNDEKEKPKPRIVYPVRILFRFHREMKSFTDKQKLKEFNSTKPDLQEILKELSRWNKKTTTRNKKIMKKFTSKGKHTKKVGNHPHTKLVVRLKDKSNKITYIHNKQ